MKRAIALPESDLHLFGCGEAQRAHLLFGCRKIEVPTEDRFHFESRRGIYRGVALSRHSEGSAEQR